MFSSQFEYSDNDSRCYAGQNSRNKFLWVVKVNLPQLDFVKNALFGERVQSI